MVGDDPVIGLETSLQFRWSCLGYDFGEDGNDGHVEEFAVPELEGVRKVEKIHVCILYASFQGQVQINI